MKKNYINITGEKEKIIRPHCNLKNKQLHVGDDVEEKEKERERDKEKKPRVGMAQSSNLAVEAARCSD